MCGIAGFLDLSRTTPRDELEHRVARMTAALGHRGPDGSGTWADGDVGVALGHRRLSIIDLSDAGQQPMHSACGRYVISTNGEIYNFRALRAELEGLGHVFAGRCDTEVMLAAIRAWGLAGAIEKFNGMFAFALWDRQNRQLHLGRDRVGEKPLYYGWVGNVFLFGSELKALRRHPAFDGSIDRDALTLYLRYRYIPAPYSIHKGISKVAPGTILTVRPDRSREEPHVTTYWSARDEAERAFANPITCAAEETVDRLAGLLTDSVKLRMESDRPFGAFLSGGVDSSTIVALMRQETPGRVKTFSIGFEEADEAVHARKVSEHLETDHTEQYVTATDALDIIPRLPSLYDEPFSDSSQIPTFLISVLARDTVAVILTGDGGDELFGGYGRYRLANDCGLPIVEKEDRTRFYRSRMSHWLDPASIVRGSTEPSSVLSDPAQWAAADDFRHQMMLMDVLTYLPDDLLVKLDRAAMGVGLETRVPFLDHHLMQYAWRLPLQMTAGGDVRKWALRQILHRYLPPALIDRPKQGFEIPLDTWLRNGLRDWAESLLNEHRLQQEGFFDPGPIREKWELHLSGRREGRHQLWSILMFEAWLEDQ